MTEGLVRSIDGSVRRLAATSRSGAEPEAVSEFRIRGNRMRWVLYFGPNRVEWSGRLEGDFLVGELRGQGPAHGSFRGYWTAVRSSARVQPRRDEGS